jgi:hypothetical protein
VPVDKELSKSQYLQATGPRALTEGAERKSEDRACDGRHRQLLETRGLCTH